MQQPPKSSLPRTHRDYWASRLFQNTYTHDGQRMTVPDYCVKIQVKGRRETFALAEANKVKAAAKARDIYACIVANGWPETLKRFKPEMERKIEYPTVGEFLAAARRVSTVRPSTFEIYASKFRTIVAGVMGIAANRDKFDYVNGGTKAYREKIESVRLGHITPDRVQKWAAAYLAKVADNPAKLASAKTSLNAHIRGGRCLFVKRIIHHLTDLTLPKPLPFDEVEAPAAVRKRYESRFDAFAIYQKAEAELGRAKDADGPEMFCVLTLGLFAGLRRDEIDTLQWSQIDFEQRKVRIETNEFTSVKSVHSEDVVSLAPEIVDYLQRKKEATTGIFVIASHVEPRPGAKSYHHYRCSRLFDRLVRWLHENGVKDRSPIHTLRKEFGSAIARRHGIYAASEALRHGDIRLTRDYYLARDSRYTLSPSELMRKDRGGQVDRAGPEPMAGGGL